MQRVHEASMKMSLRAIDAAVVVLSFVLVAWARQAFGQFWTIDIVPGQRLLQAVTLQNQLHLIVPILPAWLGALHAAGCYEDLRRTRKDVLFIKTVRAGVYATLGLLLLVFIFQPSTPTSRSFLLSYALVSVLALFWARLWIVRRATALDQQPYNILVVGSAVEAAPFLDTLSRRRDWGLRIVGVIRPDDEEVTSVNGVKVLGTLSQLHDVLAQNAISQVFMTGRAWDTSTLREVADTCEEVGVTFSMDANFLGLSVSRADVQDFDGWSVLSFASTPDNADALVIKRALDVIGATFALLIMSPLLALIALLIKLEDGGPIFFVQERSGLYGRKFPMYKFRSMVPDAEARKAALVAMNEMTGPVFKMARDPRITRIGALIRKTSLDEWPQFWNVLRGEMSLVGPRPPIPAEVARYERWQMRRLSMKPGITCIWQVSGRNTVDFDTWMRLDLEYIDNWSLFLDLKLLLRTVPAVISGSGAR
jgi:exopolysaccharide biosynthesis polyprenyl glycosylphosphotransferase